MPVAAKKPTHYRLLTSLKAIGPYLREPQSKDGHYLFDCLSVCVDDKKSPEEREFWGWWLELTKLDLGSQETMVFSAKYTAGMYNHAGEWENIEQPSESVAEVSRTQIIFHQKLEDTLAEKFGIALTIDPESAEFI